MDSLEICSWQGGDGEENDGSRCDNRDVKCEDDVGFIYTRIVSCVTIHHLNNDIYIQIVLFLPTVI